MRRKIPSISEVLSFMGVDTEGPKYSDDIPQFGISRVWRSLGVDFFIQRLLLWLYNADKLSQNQLELADFMARTPPLELVVNLVIRGFFEEMSFRITPYLFGRWLEAKGYENPKSPPALRRVLRAGILSDIAVIASTAFWAYLHVKGLEGMDFYVEFLRYFFPGLLYAAMVKNNNPLEPAVAHATYNAVVTASASLTGLLGGK